MFNYDPSKISPWELPVIDRACDKNFDLFYIRNAKDFCAALLRDRDKGIDHDFTQDEWSAVEAVANGGMWPVPDRPYTDEDWSRDKRMHAAPAQEIAESIYWSMLNVLPPYNLPRCARTREYGAGFLVSEPVCGDPCGKGMLYSAYGKKDGRYYFIGLLPLRNND